MSRDYHKFCKSIQESNDKIHNGEHKLYQDLQAIRNDIRTLSKKLDKLIDMVVRMINNEDY